MANTWKTEIEGYEVEFIARRGSFDCNVYQNGEIVAELSYPKTGRMTPLDASQCFAAEAVAIARREPAKGESHAS